jgi:drug/metabolite transporter (DMT)-like permease
MIAAAGVFCSLCGHILGRGLNRKYLKPLDMALGQIAGAAIVSSLMGFGYFLYVDFEESIFDLMGDLITFPIFLYLVIFATVINFPLYNFALSKIPVAWVSLYAVFVAPIGALFSNYFLNEPISQKDIIAIFIILSGVLIPSIHKIRREKFA